MNCTCVDLNGKYFYDTGVIYRKRITGIERIEKVEVRLPAAWGAKHVCVDLQIVGSRLGIDGIESLLTEPQKLEINCRRHTASHYSEAAWPCSTLSQSISYYNHANCGQIRDLTYWYYIPVQPLGYASLLGSSNNMYYVPLLFSVSTHEQKILPVGQYCCAHWIVFIEGTKWTPWYVSTFNTHVPFLPLFFFFLSPCSSSDSTRSPLCLP